MKVEIDTDEYGSDIAIDSVAYATKLATKDTGLTSAQTSFIQSILPAASSDYGSDLDSDEERELFELIAKIEGSGGAAVQSGGKDSEAREDDEDYQQTLRIPKVLSSQDSGNTSIYHSALESWNQISRTTGAGVQPSEAVEPTLTHYDLARTADGKIDDRPGHGVNTKVQEPIIKDDMVPESRLEEQLDVPVDFAIPQIPLKAPIHRFRASRPLSVSDLVSPTWCELQYSNNLNKHGRIPRSAAMKRGGEVHKQLELEVHEFVPVEVRTQEDSWGLRIWNVIQGLRTLRVTGMTRELDVWGIVDGEVISGVIDEITLTCPDTELEMALQVPDEQSSTPKKESDQMTIDEFFAGRKAKQEKIEALGQQVYLIDTKTRAYPSLPSASSMRPTKIQLMLYRHLLSLQASNSVPAEAIFTRYGLDATKQFSSIFMDEIARLDFSAPPNIPSSESSTMSELRTHSNLESLWSLMATEFVLTFTPLILSPILTAIYRSQASGSLIGQKSFVHDDTTLSRHIDDELQWWRGQRAPRGVEIEDAFKCKFCEFTDDCSWRMAKEAEAIEKAKNKVGRPRGRSKSKGSIVSNAPM